MESVLKQDYPYLEYVIIDGGSTDGTLDIIRSFGSDRITLQSGKDNGLYDALNKGLKAVTGDITGILHSDDFYPHGHVISHIVSEFESGGGPDAVSTSVSIFRNNDFERPFRMYDATRFKSWQFRLGMQPPHPGFFIRKDMLDKVGAFNDSYRISGDFDWLLRVIRIHKAKVRYSTYVSVYMRDGGISSSGFMSKKLMNAEILRILKSHGIYSNIFMVYFKYFLKIFQLRLF